MPQRRFLLATICILRITVTVLSIDSGQHETASFREFSYGLSNRGASVRIPWQVEVDGKGYIEDRRPNANMDPYTVTRLIVETVGAALSK